MPQCSIVFLPEINKGVLTGSSFSVLLNWTVCVFYLQDLFRVCMCIRNLKLFVEILPCIQPLYGDHFNTSTVLMLIWMCLVVEVSELMVIRCCFKTRSLLNVFRDPYITHILIKFILMILEARFNVSFLF